MVRGLRTFGGMKALIAPAAIRRHEAAELTRSRLAVLLSSESPPEVPFDAPPESPSQSPPEPPSQSSPDAPFGSPGDAPGLGPPGAGSVAMVDPPSALSGAASARGADRAAKSLPDDWPHGYGRRTSRRRAASTPGSDRAADPVADPVRAALSTVAALDPHDPIAVPSAQHAYRASRFGSRLPGALQSLFWVDRKAVLGLVLLLLIAVGYAVQHFWLGRPQAVAVPVAAARPVARPVAESDPGAPPEPAGPETAAQSEPAAPAAPVEPADAAGSGPASPPSGGAARGAPALAPVVVDIAGRVTHPGVRTLTGGSRVADALRAAGGALPGVDTDGLNLARVLVDGEQVLVGAPAPPVAAQPSAAPRSPVSLNRATLDQLDALPGVGPVLARHILDFRSSHGLFRSVEQLRQISGIGERKLSDLKPLLTL